MKREPILFIRGSEERAKEIKHIMVDEWGGSNINDLWFVNDELAYYINEFGKIICLSIGGVRLNEAIENGWMDEYVLPEKQSSRHLTK